MIDRQALLKDLQRLLRTLEADLRERCDEVAEVGAVVRAEYDAAKEAERTAQTFEAWRADYITQIAAAWVLSCVFARFLEDNELVDPPRIAGPGDRLRRARDEHELHFRNHLRDTDREYLLSVFDALAKLPGGRDIFGEHNAVHQQRDWLSGDAAKELLGFFQRIEPESGELVHDFTDPEWDTRFLGDLYQDLSEAARKKFALLQTPEFVEEFILDRTLDPAVEEFGLDGFRMIDPACGSGHFLLGSFQRLFDRWCKDEPGTNARVLAQRVLDSIHGVDINPYAVAIARFRLLLAALRACDIRRLVAPFRMNLACGDSLLHGAGSATSFGWHKHDHVYATEDANELVRILKPGHYHAVVANPPYITPKDKSLSQAYRELYSTCHRQYSLAVPFMQRLFGLAASGHLNESGHAGYVGQITANSFMKREFGKKIIEDFFAGRDGVRGVELTHVIDTSGAYIPGHGTPTVILFGRNRPWKNGTIRTAMGIRGEPATPDDPARGLVWSAIVDQLDRPGSQSEFVSVGDSPREAFHKHPWSIGGGGAAELKAALDMESVKLLDIASAVGYQVITGEDNCLILPRLAACRARLSHFVPLVEGDELRHWNCTDSDVTLWPNSPTGTRLAIEDITDHVNYLWPHRTCLRNRKAFGVPVEKKGIPWWALREVYCDKLETPFSIGYGEVTSHNHFVLDRGGKVFKQTAPVIKLPADAKEDDYLALTGLLNSSTACFWMRQTCFPKGGDHVGQEGARVRRTLWDERYAFNSTNVEKFPITEQKPLDLARQLDRHGAALGEAISAVEHKDTMCQKAARAVACKFRNTLQHMVYLQEELDWECYRLYGLIDDILTFSGEPLEIEPGERAFEILLARKMAAGEVQTVWFDRNGSKPITEIPDDWPHEYRALVERRIEAIETNNRVRLIEQPEYKRRWNVEPWEHHLQGALQRRLLGRLEAYFDYDGRIDDCAEATAPMDIELISTARLADAVAQDDDFMKVAELYRGRQDFDVGLLVAELVDGESVPLLPVLRYKPAAMDKRTAWERTWDLQRQEDAIDARTELPKDDPNYLTEDQAKNEKQRQVGDIPVPAKYKGSDFQKSSYWRLRGKLDVPKERWVSFPHCEGEDQTLMVAWAGYDHLQLARAVAAYFAKMQEEIGGSDDPRLVPLLGCILELVPWLKQWHNDIDPEYNMRMGDYFESFVEDEARTLGLTIQDIRNWEPPQRNNRRGRRTSRS